MTNPTPDNSSENRDPILAWTVIALLFGIPTIVVVLVIAGIMGGILYLARVL